MRPCAAVVVGEASPGLCAALSLGEAIVADLIRHRVRKVQGAALASYIRNLDRDEVTVICALVEVGRSHCSGIRVVRNVVEERACLAIIAIARERDPPWCTFMSDGLLPHDCERPWLHLDGSPREVTGLQATWCVFNACVRAPRRWAGEPAVTVRAKTEVCCKGCAQSSAGGQAG